MKWGPTGTYYFGDGTFKPLNKLQNTEKTEYESRVNELLSNFRTRRAADGDELDYWLEQACNCGILFYPNGKAVTPADVRKMAANPATMAERVSDLVLVKHNFSDNTNEYYAMNMVNRKVAIGQRPDFDSEIYKKEQAFHQKNFNAAQIQRLNKMEKTERKAHLDDVNKLLDKLGEGGLALGSPELQECLESAIDKGCVRTLGGVIPAKSNAKEFARTPAFLKALLFTQRAEKDLERVNTYRLVLSDENPPTVKLDLAKDLSVEEMGQMMEVFDALDKKEGLPAKLADALKDDNKSIIADCEKQMKEFGYRINYLDGMQAFSLKDEKQVYFYGSHEPVSTPEDLVKAVRHIDPPKAPNKWGIFEFLRKGWNGIFHNLPDYQDYEREKDLYELDKYRLAEKAGLDVSKLENTAKAAEAKYGSLYEAYRRHQEVEAWSRDFEKRSMNADEKAFIKDFTDAMKQYPDIAAQIMKDAPEVSKKMLDELVFTAQPYAELSQAGDFDKKKLGVLSALGVAAESGLFSSELKEQIFGLCKALNKDFGSTYGAEFLTGAQEDKAVADVESGKSAKELENEPQAETVVVGGGDKNGVVDLDDVEPEKEQKPEVGGNENKVVNLDEEVDLEELDNALRAMTEEQKRILADKIDGLTEGEKNTLEKLAKDYGLDLNNLDVNKTVSETVTEKTMDVPQANV